MAKFCGNIGFAQTVENPPGIWTESVVEKKYYGDILKDNRLYQSSGSVNDNLNLSFQLSVIADPYIAENFTMMRYIEYMHAKWKITDASVQYPRIILSIGGLYNE